MPSNPCFHTYRVPGPILLTNNGVELVEEEGQKEKEKKETEMNQRALYERFSKSSSSSSSSRARSRHTTEGGSYGGTFQRR